MTKNSEFPELMLVLQVIRLAQEDMKAHKDSREHRSARQFFESDYYRHLFELVQSCMPHMKHWEVILPTGVSREI